MNISYSRVASYLNCPYAHYLNYEIGVIPNKPQRPLYFGRDFHKLLEVRGDKKSVRGCQVIIQDTYYNLSPQHQNELGPDYLENLFSIFQDYCTVYENAPLPTVTEQEFEIPIFEYEGEPYLFKGKIDELYKRKNRKTGERYIKIGEHKTFSRKPDNNTLVMNVQKNLYAKAIQILTGILPKTVIWDYICSSPAPTPIWLESSKRFSQTKSTQITPFSYLRACKELNIDINDSVLEMADSYKGNIPNYFFRVEQDFIPAMVESTWNDFLFQANLIAKYGHKNKTKNMSYHCSFCQYHDICYTQLTEGNLKYLMIKDFKIVPREDIQNEKRRAIDDNFKDLQ